jgi:hypothetical protein
MACSPGSTLPIADLAAGMVLQDLVTANRIVSETETEAMREQSAALVVRVKLATETAPHRRCRCASRRTGL